MLALSLSDKFCCFGIFVFNSFLFFRFSFVLVFIIFFVLVLVFVNEFVIFLFFAIFVFVFVNENHTGACLLTLYCHACDTTRYSTNPNPVVLLTLLSMTVLRKPGGPNSSDEQTRSCRSVAHRATLVRRVQNPSNSSVNTPAFVELSGRETRPNHTFFIRSILTFLARDAFVRTIVALSPRC